MSWLLAVEALVVLAEFLPFFVGQVGRFDGDGINVHIHSISVKILATYGLLHVEQTLHRPMVGRVGTKPSAEQTVVQPN